MPAHADIQRRMAAVPATYGALLLKVADALDAGQDPQEVAAILRMWERGFVDAALEGLDLADRGGES